MSEHKIKISVTAPTRNEAIELLENKFSQMRENEFIDCCAAGGGMDGCGFSIYSGPRPLTLGERVNRLEKGSA